MATQSGSTRKLAAARFSHSDSDMHGQSKSTPDDGAGSRSRSKACKVQGRSGNISSAQTRKVSDMQVGYFTERPYRWLPEEEILKNRAFFGRSQKVLVFAQQFGNSAHFDPL